MKFITAIALATLAATPAFAANGKKKQRHYHQSYNQMRQEERQFGPGQQPTCVLSYNRRRIAGCDPDPNIRQSLQDEDAFFRRD